MAEESSVADAAPKASTSPSGGDGGAGSAQAVNSEDRQSWRRKQQAMEIGTQALLGRSSGSTNNFYFGGDMTVADHVGDHYHDQGGVATAIRTGKVTAQVLERLRECFVRPANYNQVRRRLEEHHVVFLCSPRGSGRSTAALFLLDELCGAGVHKLDPEVSLKALPSSTFQRDHGYLLDGIDTHQARMLRGFHADHLATVLRDRGCLLVIVVDDASAVAHEDLHDHVEPELGAVDTDLLMRKHLQWELPDDPDAITVLDQPEIRRLVEGLSTHTTKRQMAALATEFVKVRGGKITAAEVVERYQRTSDTGFDTWFDNLVDSDQRAFVIALAVFNKGSVQLVADAATMLATRLRRVEVPNYKERGRSLFAVPLVERLVQARAIVVSSTTDFGSAELPTRDAEFLDESYAPRVLTRLMQYSEAFGLVLDWLLDLGHIQDDIVRTRAGLAAGFFARTDFTTIFNRLILRWAASGDADERWAASAALRIAGDDPVVKRAVVELVEFWSRHSVRNNLRLAATHATGTTTSMSTERALRLLRGVAAKWTLPDAVDVTAPESMPIVLGESVCAMLLDTEKTEIVLATLRTWSVDLLEPYRRNAALLAVLMASYRLTGEEPGSAVRWPAMVWLSEKRPELRADIASLLATLLQAPSLLTAGYGEIMRWVKLSYQDEPGLRGPIRTLLDAIADEIGDNSSLHYYINEWASRHPKRAGTAAEITGAVEREGNTHA